MTDRCSTCADTTALAADLRERCHAAERKAAAYLEDAERSERYAAERREALLAAERRVAKAEAENERLLGMVMSGPSGPSGPAWTADERAALEWLRIQTRVIQFERLRSAPSDPHTERALAVLDRLLGDKPDRLLGGKP